MERMVRKKKVKPEPNGSGEQQVTEMPVPDAHKQVTPYIESDTEIMHKLQRLLNEAPRRPEFYRIEDAVSFADQYDQWYRKVTVELQ